MMMGVPCFFKPYRQYHLLKDLLLVFSIAVALVLGLVVLCGNGRKQKQEDKAGGKKAYPVPSPSRSAVIVTLDKFNMTLTKAVIKAFDRKGKYDVAPAVL